LRGLSAIGRIAAIAALAIAAVAVIVLLGGAGGDDYEVTAEFENASQLVGGEQVVVGGVSAGSVKEIELGPNGQALVTFSVDDEFAPLGRGTTATIRTPSLTSIAGRQVQLTLPPDSEAGEEIPDGGTLSQAETVSAVDLDELFNTLDPKTIKDFKHVIQGFALAYEGVGRQANRGFHYANPFLSTSRRLFGELSADDRALENLIVDTSQLSGALAARAPDLQALIANLNQMMNAIGDRKERLARAIELLPGFMREANTTFVNLRAALDDLDPLVAASRPVARRLRPFFSELRAAARDAVPTIRDTQRILKRNGRDNDLTDLTRLQVPLARAAIGSGSPDCGAGPADPADLEVAADDDYTQGGFGEAVCALRNSEDALSFFRAYTPELVGWFEDFGHSGYIDAIGPVGRVASTFNTFSLSASGLPFVGPLADPVAQTPDQEYAGLTTGLLRRCPGANERPVPPADASDDSVPFTDGGALTDGTPGDCDPTDLPPGP
jgi:phospholipid/cholesterol/gamma-HCH transport system substrate-binding protein